MKLETPRLLLYCLEANQLAKVLERCSDLGLEHLQELDAGILDANVTRAIGMKMEKMRQRPTEEHPWLTYWLVVERTTQLGIGFVGFKGTPEASGESEIGYGLAPIARGRGYATEAVGALCAWAFTDPALTAITATTVTHPDSSRVLEKLGAEVVRKGEGTTDWKLLRDPLTQQGPRPGRGPSREGVS